VLAPPLTADHLMRFSRSARPAGDESDGEDEPAGFVEAPDPSAQGAVPATGTAAAASASVAPPPGKASASFQRFSPFVGTAVGQAPNSQQAPPTLESDAVKRP
jgi:hypothetical protein